MKFVFFWNLERADFRGKWNRFPSFKAVPTRFAAIFTFLGFVTVFSGQHAFLIDSDYNIILMDRLVWSDSVTSIIDRV